MSAHPEVSVLAVECQAEVPSRRSLPGRPGSGGIVVAQERGETTPQFAARVVERVRRLERRGSHVARFVLVCDERSDMQAAAQRLFMMRSVLAGATHLSDCDVSIESRSRSMRFQNEAILQTIREHELHGALSVIPSTTNIETPLRRVA